MTPVWRLAILAALAGMMQGHRPAQHPTQQRWPRSETKWNQIVKFTWRSGPPSSRSWPSSCAGLTWNDLCDRATPRQNKWRPKCGNIGKDTGEIPPGICRPMFVRLCQRSPARIWSTWWRQCAASWTMNRPSTTSAGLWDWLHSPDTSCRIDRLLCSACSRPSTLAGAKELEQERPVFWPRLPLSWRTTRSTSWRSGYFGLCCPATNSLRCSSGFNDMPEPRAPLALPPLPLARSPGPAWIDRRRLWRRWRFKTGTARRLTTRRKRLRSPRSAAPSWRLLLLHCLRGLLRAHTELYRGFFLFVFGCVGCVGCVGRQRLKPLLSAPRPHPPQQSSHPGPKSRGSTSALNLQRYILLLVIFAFLKVPFQQGELQRRTTVFRQASQACAQTCIHEGTAQSHSAWTGQVSGPVVDGPRFRL